MRKSKPKHGEECHKGTLWHALCNKVRNNIAAFCLAWAAFSMLAHARFFSNKNKVPETIWPRERILVILRDLLPPADSGIADVEDLCKLHALILAGLAHIDKFGGHG